MKVKTQEGVIEVSGKDLTVYVFCGNFDPYLGIEENELTIIKLPAPNEEYAWQRLKFLIGSARARHFHIEDMYQYD